MIRVTVWNEFIHEKNEEAIKAVYPDGIHKTIAGFLGTNEDITVTTATLDEPECGLTQEVLDNTDVLIWWAHMDHGAVPDEIAVRVQEAVLKGMGMIFLHSAHQSKPFLRLMGTAGTLGWREDGDAERLWVVNPAHPITKDIDRYFDLPHEEVYCEPFGIPDPDEVLLIGWYEGGEVFRSCCTWRRGMGKVVYIQPGHESYGNYHLPHMQRLITNAVRWVAPAHRIDALVCPNVTKPTPHL